MKTIKIIIIFILLCITIKSNAFHSKLIIVVPTNTLVYVNNVLFNSKNDGTYIITLGKAKNLNIRFEKEGYITNTMLYMYNRTNDKVNNITFYKRGTNYFSIELIKK